MGKSFPMVPLGEILTERWENLSEDAIVFGKIPIIAKISFKDGSIQFRNDYQTKTGMITVRPGDLIVSGINATKGAIAIYGQENAKPIAATIHYGAYTPNKEKANVLYIWRFLRSRMFRDLLIKHVPEGIKTELKAKRLLPIPIPLPPLEEQQRIVARIEELATKIREAHRLHQEAIEERELLKEAAANTLFRNHDNASVLPLRDLVTVSGGGTPSKSNPFFWEGNIPWISPKDMKVRDISEAINHISEQAIAESSAKLIDPGAVLIVVRGMILTHTVPSAVLRAPAAINQDMKALMPGEKLMPEYLCNCLWALNKDLLNLVEKSTHDTRKLETPKLLAWKIPVPPLPEQQRIVTYLDNLQSQIERLKHPQSEISAELDAMFPSILDKAFKGEL